MFVEPMIYVPNRVFKTCRMYKKDTEYGFFRNRFIFNSLFCGITAGLVSFDFTFTPEDVDDSDVIIGYSEHCNKFVANLVGKITEKVLTIEIDVDKLNGEYDGYYIINRDKCSDHFVKVPDGGVLISHLCIECVKNHWNKFVKEYCTRNSDSVMIKG